MVLLLCFAFFSIFIMMLCEFSIIRFECYQNGCLLRDDELRMKVEETGGGGMLGAQNAPSKMRRFLVGG